MADGAKRAVGRRWPWTHGTWRGGFFGLLDGSSGGDVEQRSHRSRPFMSFVSAGRGQGRSCEWLSQLGVSSAGWETGRGRDGWGPRQALRPLASQVLGWAKRLFGFFQKMLWTFWPTQYFWSLAQYQVSFLSPITELSDGVLFQDWNNKAGIWLNPSILFHLQHWAISSLNF